MKEAEDRGGGLGLGVRAGLGLGLGTGIWVKGGDPAGDRSPEGGRGTLAPLGRRSGGATLDVRRRRASFLKLKNFWNPPPLHPKWPYRGFGVE